MLHGHVTIGKLLIDRKADKSLKDTIGLNLVHYAINGGHFNAIRFALDNAEDDALIEQNQFGGNILIYAIFMRCHVKIIKLLIGYDHRIKTSSEQKTEALHLADITNQCETLAYLQKSFANFVVKD
ncbi:uncharacterized protein LOC119068535 [Bradysia coprophila]|uniref:uncharacterized protein LOC119068535 n=1 Tax=Bradysia coprophila TaxID=38358 RepID=UPI00187D9029|nr:uncharacterized protein LOC119068535 [Bradysia coprophila]